MKNNRYWAVLAALCLVIFLSGLGNLALTDPDETFYAQTSKEMLEAGDWVTPRIFGEPQYEKPIFHYWLVISSYKIFGVNEFAARFPSAVLAIFGILGIFLIARLLYSPLTGFLSAAIMATSLEYLVVGKACVTDMTLTVAIIYTLLFFLRGWVSGSKCSYFACAVSAAVAVLTKGPIGLFIPGAVILIYLSLTGQIRELFRRVPVFSSFLVFLAAALPWYAAVFMLDGKAFMDEFFGFHNITRFIHPEHTIGDTPFFYLPVAIGGLFPWSVFFLFALWDIYGRKKNGINSAVGQDGSLRSPKVFLAAWFLLVFLFFSASRTKLVTYILPLFPAMAIITGKFWADMAEGGVPGEKVRRAFWFFSAVSLAAAAGALGLVWHEFPGSKAVIGAVIGSVVFIVSVLVSWRFLLKGKILGAFWAIIASVVLIIPPVIIYIFPPIEEYESRKALSTALKELAGPGERVGAESDHRRGVAFYSGRIDVEDIHPSEKRSEFFKDKNKVWGIIKIRHYEQVKQELKEKAPVEIKRSGKHVLVTNLPLS